MSYDACHDPAFTAFPARALAEVGRDLKIDLALDEAPAPARAKIAAVPLSWQPAGGTPYGRAVLASLVRRIGVTEEPGRNIELNRCAFLAGGYVAGGELDRDLTIRSLLDAALLCGLSLMEAASTVRSGLTKGMRKPLYAPR